MPATEISKLVVEKMKGEMELDLSEDQVEPFFEWLNEVERDVPIDEISDRVADFQDAYCGCWNSFREYAEDMVREILACELSQLTRVGQRPDDLLMYRYFDYEKFAHDLEMDYTVLQSPSVGVYVFSP